MKIEEVADEKQWIYFAWPNVHPMHPPWFHQQEISCLSLIHSLWNVIRVCIISDLIAQTSNACLFLSVKQNDTTRQLLHSCVASMNEQRTTYLIACKSHSQTLSTGGVSFPDSITGGVSFPDYQYWESLIPRPLILWESHSYTPITGRVSFPEHQYWESLIPRLPVLGESHSQTPQQGESHSQTQYSTHWESRVLDEIKFLTLHRTCMLL